MLLLAEVIGLLPARLLAPEVFDQREDDGIVLLLDEYPGDELHATVREAAIVCPGAAISVHETA
ncbi:ferredoxin [Amycolatopsis benzoatilytica]|uniref:ferredoxin n=1 Tax=Amycolatopsis benzoatilytica TaxID=346045 RepID=UPI000360DE1B|nr:ferredoxin [Amycolatopsis benzoatilytica]